MTGALARMSSFLVKQADKLTLGLVGAACIAALGDAYVKRVKTLEGGQKVVDAMLKEKERLQSEKPPSTSVESDQVRIIPLSKQLGMQGLQCAECMRHARCRPLGLVILQLAVPCRTE